MPEPTEAWHESVEWGETAASDRVKEFGSVNDLAKGYDEAVGKIQSKGILIPGDKATDDERGAFKDSLREHLGVEVPKDASGYGWETPDDVKDHFSDLDGQLKRYHEAGYDKETVKHILDEQAESLRVVFAGIQDAQADVAKQSKEALTEKWGEDYDPRMEGLAKVMDQHPDAIDALKAAGLANSQPILEMMDDVARSIKESHPDRTSDQDRVDAQTELKTLKATKAYTSGRDPGHAETMKRVMTLQKIITSQ